MTGRDFSLNSRAMVKGYWVAAAGSLIVAAAVLVLLAVRSTAPPPQPQPSSQQETEAVIYVWPQRLLAAAGANQGGDEVPSSAEEDYQGHYRHRRDVIWHPHPVYQLRLQNGSSWGRLELEAADDEEFVATNRAEVQLIDESTNSSSSMTNWLQSLRPCFFRGKLQADPQSEAILSLCHGLTGHLRTSRGSYFIEPSPAKGGEEEDPQVNRPIRHVLYRIRHREPFDQPLNDRPSSTHRDSLQGRKRRTRRSVSQERFVEILVVADGKMVSYHGENLAHYILTLMSVVSLIYKDASLGNPVHIAVVRMLLLKDQEFVLPSAGGGSDGSEGNGIGIISPELLSLDNRPGKSASEMLRNFCKWQKSFNDPDDNSDLHHDTALLLTRENICRNPQMQKCDTLGLAELGTMCDMSTSCSIVQDNGLSAAFTIAHELGHVLNMPHDDDFKCQQFVESSGVHNVMSRMLDHNTFPWAWSNCSRHFITEYLDGGYGDCLLDRPSMDMLDNHRAAKKLPGENFDENKQCELVFGNGSKICPYMPPCKRLWCTTSGGEQEGCRTQHMPWADGTPCGRNRWCRHGSCLPRDAKSLEPVDGQWGAWQEWMMGTCSRTCGGGVQRSTRNCDSPAPSNGGTFCLGKRVRYRSCNTQECPAGSQDFREKQCADFNNNNFNIQGLPADVKWVPKYGVSEKDRCQLYCRVEHSSAYYLLKGKVIDGTSCGPDTDDICVNGICKPASCNHVLGRREQLDLCGVCGGDNSTCVIMNGSYNASQYGYNHVTRIPAGSSSLDVRQRGYQGSNRDDNYLALLDPQTGEYLLNGNFVVSMFAKTIQFGGATIEYSGSDAVVERLNSSKPLKKDVVIQVLSVGNLYAPDIWYQYVVSRTEGRAPAYQWKLQDQWSTCSRLCQGQQFRKPVCMQVLPGGSQQKMPEEYCSNSPPPPVETQPCQTQCVLRWRVTHRSECSAHCGPGFRNVTKQCEQDSLPPLAQQPSPTPLDPRHCRHLTDTPPETEACTGTCKWAHWHFDPWSNCSKPCGGGEQTRKAQCVDLNDRVLPEVHCQAEQKIVHQSCNVESCPQWRVGDWTPCSVTCGPGGERQRPYWCQVEGTIVSRSYCYPVRPPDHREPCPYQGDCPQWHASQWGQCSATCGVGEAQRNVGCRAENGSLVDHSHCAGQERPSSIQQCVERPCPTEPPTTTTTTTTEEPLLTTEHPSVAIGPVTSAPIEALAGYRPQSIEIHIDPTLNSINGGSNGWNSESNDVPAAQPRIYGTWRAGSWGQCSATCDGGMRMRSVVCYDLLGSREVNGSYCSGHAPRSFEQCGTQPCASWTPLNWSACSVTCGRGVSIRTVECRHLVNNSAAPDELCSGEKPPTERSCSAPLAVCGGSPISHSVSVEHNHTSKVLPQWRTGSWGSCSKTCGGGFKRRQVVCHDELLKESDSCVPAKRPQDTVHCNTDPCPSWSSGDWSPCSKTCGGGTQTRPVTCRDHLGQTVPDHRCHPPGRPEYSQTCRTEPCPTTSPIPAKTYKWRTAHWTTCSKTCGKGDQYREVYCWELEGRMRVGEDRCPASSRPRSHRGCNKAACPYSWLTEDWSDCSHPCGAGIQHRRVTCHRVNAYEWTDPEPVSFGCNSTVRPPDLQPCQMGDCSALYSWKTSAWQPCVASRCGRQGFQKRSLACVSRSGARVSRSFCPQEFRPIRKKRCRAPPCGYTSCKDVQQRPSNKTENGELADGPYTLLVAGRNITIYCHGMNTTSPKEYLTLVSGQQDNYAEVYDKTLVRPDNCPYQGARKESCDCFHNRRSTGTTSFSKIRLNVTSLRVDGHDFTFARLVKGHQLVGYGEAGDCYSTANCPQGRFSINLLGTGLRVSPHTSWAGHGHRASLWINRLEDNQKIQGKCGGYCGRCSPDPHAGLKLDVL